MIDIEHKTLKYLENNLDHLEALKDKTKIKEEIFLEPSHISKWDSNERLFLYIKIMQEILAQNKLIEVNKALRVCLFLVNEEKDHDLGMFYAIILGFYDFFKKIYTIYFLDKLKYMLTTSSEYLPPKTNSYYEEINFGLKYIQLRLNSLATNEYDIDIYNIKKFYLDFFTTFLENQENRTQYYNLKYVLKRQIREKNDYLISELLNVMDREIKISKSHVRTKKPKKDDNQISWF